MDHVPRILSLDGGGVRGLSTLLILRDIMEEIGRKMGTSTPAKPCDYFDLIGGTSTGGLIAIMLGLLGMVSFDPSRINE
jgi:patatin-like phospholipase/acyl hydrolase